MDPIDVFSRKVERYAKFRWNYAPEAIKTIIDLSGIQAESSVADIGAGTGILTREFIGKVKQIFAVEPNPQMRAIASKDLRGYPTCKIIDGRAEATTLANSSVDLITVAQAIHWFDPRSAKAEFLRILKPGGWLAICRNYGLDLELGDALNMIFPPECDTGDLMIGKCKTRDWYYGGNEYLKIDFPFESKIDWDHFLGSLSTTSFAPDDGIPQFAAFESDARMIFNQFSVNNLIHLHSVTELFLGQPAA